MISDDFGLVFVGNRGHSRWILRHILDEGWTVSGVITQPKEPQSRAIEKKTFDDICRAYDVPLLRTNDINEDRAKQFIHESNPDLGLCCGWTQIFSKSVLESPTDGFVGIHASDLPKGKGGAPVNWQIILKEDVGVSLFYLVSEVDHGDIINQSTVDVELRDTVETVYNRVTAVSCDLLDDALPALRDGSVKATPQQYAGATYLPQRTPDDGLIDWSKSASFQHDWVRALTRPYPGAFTFFNGSRVFVWSTTHADVDVTGRQDGEIALIEDGNGLVVTTGGDSLRLERVQRSGGPPMWADEFARRHGLVAGDVLGRPADFPSWLYTGIRGGEDDFAFETNVDVGESGTTTAVACSHKDPVDVKIHAAFNGRTCLDCTETVDGWSRIPVCYTPDSSGIHTLKIQFKRDDNIIDTRYLKVFSK
jgi:methionyl-tRNA formyltransferase